MDILERNLVKVCTRSSDAFYFIFGTYSLTNGRHIPHGWKVEFNLRRASDLTEANNQASGLTRAVKHSLPLGRVQFTGI